jgi:2-methylcitrate dehydratase PrpD
VSEGASEIAGEAIAQLAEWASSLSLDAIADDVKRSAALVIADNLACAARSRKEPELRALKQRLPHGVEEATVFLGDGAKTDRASAAMINAIASNWCQLDEGHRQVMCHAGLYVVPTAMAEAEAAGRTMGDALRATVAGYEVVCRFAKAFGFSRPTVHPHALWSPLGAAAAIAALRGFDPGRWTDSLATAATMAGGGPFGHAVQGALVANGWAGIGVANGFRAVDLAECRITGTPISASEVLCGVFGATLKSGLLVEGLGEEWALRGNYHKIHSCAQQSHAAVEAMLALTRRWPVGKGPADVRRIVVEGHPLTLMMDNRNPPTALAARFSIPHIVAAVATLGRADAAAFATETLADAEIVRLRRVVELKLLEPPLPAPHDRAARISLVFDDGATTSEECLSAEGGPDRPFSASRILEKCTTLTGGVYPHFGTQVSRLLAFERDLCCEPVAKFVRSLIEPS